MNYNFDFTLKFGSVSCDFDGQKCYLKNGDEQAYFIPSELTDKEILRLMNKSIKNGHDYIFDIVKGNPIEEIQDGVEL